MTRLPKRLVAVVAVAAMCGGPAAVGATEAQPAVATVDAFHADIKAGRTKAALALLAPDVYIAQQGFIDVGRDHYAGARIANDVAFARATRARRQHRHVIYINADAVEVVTQTRLGGTFHGTPVDLVQAETMLVEQRGGGWHIAAIHWSAHPVPAAAPAAASSVGSGAANRASPEAATPSGNKGRD